MRTQAIIWVENLNYMLLLNPLLEQSTCVQKFYNNQVNPLQVTFLYKMKLFIEDKPSIRLQSQFL